MVSLVWGHKQSGNEKKNMACIYIPEGTAEIFLQYEKFLSMNNFA